MPLYCEEKGNRNGPTIVFLHGGGVAGWMWKKQWEAFSDFHCLIPDLPDHGKSANAGPIDIEDCARRIAALIRERANGGRAHVVGHSLGAKIIVQMLGTQPEVIDHAVVASALFRLIPMLNLMLNMPTYRLTVWMLKNKSILEMQAKQFCFPDEATKQAFMNEASTETPEMLDRIYTQLNKHMELPGGLGKAQAPTLVIAGEKEPKAMRLSALDIANVLPNSKACLMKGGRHNFPWVQHQAFNDAIRAWITGETVEHPMVIKL